ncbi:NAD(P)/FAD-dependent oxidoreductase [Cellulomonas humilata]|uniref:NAD(P)/FAD-dependent oxidoreductase n=1 Tax=Cellulomonas humilata TaxID=144055 RepID=A0A7Y6DYE4_9CELL|nr:NAD(P)/FAD-dependent oxidoreductase [Cellulomonas humilata]NUU18563.1 NAD(P)/FAD-dependent oxidoreductase [Cellulomonas humilata]
MSNAAVLVIGAGPGGLAVAAALRRQGVASVVLERSDDVGASWRRHYERLHLHTTRRWSSLPGLPIPREFGRWVAREDVVRYLELYTAHHRLDVRTGVDVKRIARAGYGRWVLETTAGDELAGSTVVIATGYNHTPVPPSWPGVETFTGELVHASAYRNPEPYRGKDVLVVGAGNTGSEIAVDLTEGGAARVRLAIRSAPHIVRRSNLGWPAQGTGIVVRHLPVPVVDTIAAAVARVEVPDLSAFGLPRPTTGLYSRVMQGSVPLQDVGLIAAVQARRVEPVAAVDSFDDDGAVVLADGSRIAPEVIIAATGYRRGLEPLVGRLDVLDDRGLPRVHGPRTSVDAPGLYFTGYTNPISGMFRELGIDAERIARAISRG